MHWKITPMALAASLIVASCRSSAVHRDAEPSATQFDVLVERVLELYRAFDFDAGAEPDWETQRALSLEGATFLSPASPEAELRGEGIEPFIEGFRAYATSRRMAATGLHERVTRIQGHVFGGIAQLFVTFEGHFPGEADRQTHGVDCLSFVQSGGEWKMVSFTSQYERDDLAIPADFETLHWTPQR